MNSINISRAFLMLAIFFACSIGTLYSQQNEENSYALKDIKVIKEPCYRFDLTEQEIIAKEFSNVSFVLDLKQNVLKRISKSSTKEIQFTLVGNKVNLLCDNCSEIQMELSFNTENKPVLKFKEHTDDCYSSILNF